LPQIAAHADAHFRIAKREREGRTITEVEALDREGRIVELAAMLGGPVVGSAAGAGRARGAGGAVERLRTKSGLTAVGPGTGAQADADSTGVAAGSAALAQARELLDAAEAWRGEPVPVA
ncbi:MAG TPA: hypothetical protein VKC59_02900, partial [Candidatus Limnocylindrales bacterium]|nr:hypothetical protein [Candidatus Limnocylindrales bacterium]